MKIVAFIYARLSSKRLPQKALRFVGNKPLIENVIQGLRFLGNDIPRILLTSDQREDEKLVEIALKNKIGWVQGNLNNVADRTKNAIEIFKPDYFLRINGDCPIQLKDLFKKGLKNFENHDLISNVFKRTFNYGLSFEMIKTPTFIEHHSFFNEMENEHITSYFYSKANMFKIKSIENEIDYFSIGKSLSVDDFESWKFLDKILTNHPDIASDNIHELNKKINNYD